MACIVHNASTYGSDVHENEHTWEEMDVGIHVDLNVDVNVEVCRRCCRRCLLSCFRCDA